jgi:acetyl esterase/lipase
VKRGRFILGAGSLLLLAAGSGYALSLWPWRCGRETAPPAGAGPADAPLSPEAIWAIDFPNAYKVIPDLTYLVASNLELKLDVYQRLDATSPAPTLLFMHGGYWVAGTKAQVLPALLPWLEMGWNVVNVEYRLARAAPAPAAVEDCLCALRFVAARAGDYNVDTRRIVVSGESAGGHLALLLGMLPESEGLDRQCASQTALPRVAAVINWYGITDVRDLLDGAHRENPAIQWLGSVPDQAGLARRVSPLTYVRPELPPILSIHGDKDPAVPYEHSVRLHAELSKAGVPNRLFTVRDGGHGRFTLAERKQIFGAIRQFLAQQGLTGE